MEQGSRIEDSVLEGIRADLDRLIEGLDPPAPAQAASSETRTSPPAQANDVAVTAVPIVEPPRTGQVWVEGERDMFRLREPSGAWRRALRRPWLAFLVMLALQIGVAAAGITLVVSSRLNEASRVANERLERALSLAASESRKRAAAEARAVGALKKAGDAQLMLLVQAADDGRKVPLEARAAAPEAGGYASWSPTHGLAIMAVRVPPAPDGLGYRAWLVTPFGVADLGSIDRDDRGIVSGVFSVRPVDGQLTGALVTVEPLEGSARPSDSAAFEARFSDRSTPP
jgi:hypothetical protein